MRLFLVTKCSELGNCLRLARTWTEVMATLDDMRRGRAVAALLLMLLSLCAERAFAQTAYFQGGIEMDARRFSSQPDDRVFDANTSAALVGGGGFLTPMISAGVELDIGRESQVAHSVTVTIAGRPETVTTTYASRRRSVSALFGIHSAATHAVRVGAYAGLAFTAFAQRISADAPAIVLNAAPPPTEFTHLAAAPIVGVDVAVAISHHLAIVGVVRAQALGFGSELHGFSVRPGVAARVTF